MWEEYEFKDIIVNAMLKSMDGTACGERWLHEACYDKVQTQVREAQPGCSHVFCLLFSTNVKTIVYYVIVRSRSRP